MILFYIHIENEQPVVHIDIIFYNNIIISLDNSEIAVFLDRTCIIIGYLHYGRYIEPHRARMCLGT